MHIAIIGTGGVGGYFGGRLAQAGHQVSFLARGKHLEAIRQNGLRVQSLKERFTIMPYQTTDTIEEMEPADLILFCTKSWQIDDIAPRLLPLFKESTLILPLQNGADNAERIQKYMDPKHVLGGLCRIYSKIEAPGCIHHFAYPPEVTFGKLPQTMNSGVSELQNVFKNANIASVYTDDIQAAIWTKFMFIATVSGLGALTGVSIGQMYATEETCCLLEQTATEIYMIAKEKQINLPKDSVEKCMHFISKQPYEATASTQRDILEGRPSELHNFNGYIVREGERLDVLTPINAFTYYSLLPKEKIARGQL